MAIGLVNKSRSTEPTDVAAFKIYLDEVKSRLIYGAARADGVRAGRVTAPSAAESKLYTMLDFTKRGHRI